ncbi:hypothetical protein BKA62DRAFT_710810 [Auriculariales sp. MPI-PUGE-AT-0066]|nr:hypothetical protein BKA62DRAFT_710810 [Auriculariales sp. MPI-PUGE-AT-0066]
MEHVSLLINVASVVSSLTVREDLHRSPRLASAVSSICIQNITQGFEAVLFNILECTRRARRLELVSTRDVEFKEFMSAIKDLVQGRRISAHTGILELIIRTPVTNTDSYGRSSWLRELFPNLTQLTIATIIPNDGRSEPLMMTEVSFVGPQLSIVDKARVSIKGGGGPTDRWSMIGILLARLETTAPRLSLQIKLPQYARNNPAHIAFSGISRFLQTSHSIRDLRMGHAGHEWILGQLPILASRPLRLAFELTDGRSVVSTIEKLQVVLCGNHETLRAVRRIELVLYPLLLRNSMTREHFMELLQDILYEACRKVRIALRIRIVDEYSVPQ